MDRSSRWRAAQPILLLSVVLAGCGGVFDECDDCKLGVPYRTQEQFNYCVPASVLMWRLYDGLPAVSQTTIFNWLGGSACQPDDVPDAVNHFTGTYDTYLDLRYNPTQTEIDRMMARQITSIDRGTPVIPIVTPWRYHVGVINGGKYSNLSGGYYRWEYLYFHDPDPNRGANFYYTAGHWLDEFCSDNYDYCGQIVSSSAVAGWESNLIAYSSKVRIYGREGRDGGPIEY